MDIDRYIAQLERQNGYCECPELQELFEKRRKLEALEASCSSFERNTDFENPRPEDIDFLLAFRKVVGKYPDQKDAYFTELGASAERGDVRLVLHDTERFFPSEDNISIDEVYAMTEIEGRDALVTVNCNSCNQQIDTVDEVSIE